MSAPLRLGPNVRSQLEGLRTRVRLALLGRGAARLVGVFLVWCAISYALDRPLRLAWGTRATLWGIGALGVGWTLWWRLIRPLSRELPDAELARALERANPSLRWRLLSAVQFAVQSAVPGTSAELTAEVVRQAEHLASSELDLAPAVPLEPVLKRVGLAALGIALISALSFGFPAEAGTWCERNLLLSSQAQWPQDTYLELVSVNGRPMSEVGQTIRVPRGADLELAVRVREGVTPQRVYLIAEGLPGAEDPSPFDDRGPQAEARYDPSLGRTVEQKSRFVLHVERVPNDFTFWIKGGDSRIGPFELKAVVPPFVDSIEIEARPPPYTGRKPRKLLLESSSLSFPVGTELVLTARATKPLREAWVTERATGAEVTTRVACELASLPGETQKRVLARRWIVERTTQLTIGVLDEDQAELSQPPQFSVVAVPDNAPGARLELSGVGLNVTKRAKIGYTITGKDDHGLSGGELRVLPGGRAKPKKDAKPPEGGWPDDRERGIAAEPALSGPEATARGVLELKGLRLEPKMSLRLWAAVRDGRPGEAQRGVSPTITLRIVSEEQLLNELLRRLYEQRQLLEKLARDEDELGRAQASLDPKTIPRGPAVHRDVRRAVGRCSKAVAQVVTEMESNEILDGPTRTRLRTEVIEALADLRKNELARGLATAEAADEAAEAELPALAADAAQASRDVSAAIREIADRMGRIEELAEIVAQLKRIIRRQRALMDKSREPK
ncbi:MAG: hypothetical protein JKY65_02710 [Planctomycetes bacterium]|nr:hypothetical protein [Planctomycetota bacterium]